MDGLFFLFGFVQYVWSLHKVVAAALVVLLLVVVVAVVDDETVRLGTLVLCNDCDDDAPPLSMYGLWGCYRNQMASVFLFCCCCCGGGCVPVFFLCVCVLLLLGAIIPRFPRPFFFPLAFSLYVCLPPFDVICCYYLVFFCGRVP